ncbi:predicted protein [Naegleria gruberi]|uniref:Predicted protein n=1 Tax=Naegleria gruberi TaxID=5762 RepID=D2VBA8_NAEGR|nr:uncharacterized protein NAEGRDRAFT_66150 [Naegleria gruberi]EFC45876.1 predicted protein [Naegleria gruberi]|eukprot:XP_002678620.1 predicted protein [Naegleria gruberi strain NEG-M]
MLSTNNCNTTTATTATSTSDELSTSSASDIVNHHNISMNFANYSMNNDGGKFKSTTITNNSSNISTFGGMNYSQAQQQAGQFHYHMDATLRTNSSIGPKSTSSMTPFFQHPHSSTRSRLADFPSLFELVPSQKLPDMSEKKIGKSSKKKGNESTQSSSSTGSEGGIHFSGPGVDYPLLLCKGFNQNQECFFLGNGSNAVFDDRATNSSISSNTFTGSNSSSRRNSVKSLASTNSSASSTFIPQYQQEYLVKNYARLKLKKDNTSKHQEDNQIEYLDPESNVNNKKDFKFNLEDCRIIATAQSCTVMVLNDNEVWACGINERGMLGVGHTDEFIFEGTPIEFIGNGKTKSAISAADKQQTSLKSLGFMTSEATLTGFDEGPKSYAHSVSDIAQSTFCSMLSAQEETKHLPPTIPTKIPFNFDNEHITKVSIGYRHIMFLTREGRVYGCGSNSHGELALGLYNKNHGIGTPQFIFTLENDKIIDVHCGYDWTLFLTSEGRVLVCGKNRSNRENLSDIYSKAIADSLNLNIIEECISQPTELPGIFEILDGNDSIAQLKASSSSFYMLSRKGVILVYGKNDRGQLGLGHKEDVKGVPVELTFFEKEKNRVTSLHPTQDNICFLTTNDKVYISGACVNSDIPVLINTDSHLIVDVLTADSEGGWYKSDCVYLVSDFQDVYLFGRRHSKPEKVASSVSLVSSCSNRSILVHNLLRVHCKDKSVVVCRDITRFFEGYKHTQTITVDETYIPFSFILRYLYFKIKDMEPNFSFICNSIKYKRNIRNIGEELKVTILGEIIDRIEQTENYYLGVKDELSRFYNYLNFTDNRMTEKTSLKMEKKKECRKMVEFYIHCLGNGEDMHWNFGFFRENESHLFSMQFISVLDEYKLTLFAKSLYHYMYRHQLPTAPQTMPSLRLHQLPNCIHVIERKIELMSVPDNYDQLIGIYTSWFGINNKYSLARKFKTMFLKSDPMVVDMFLVVVLLSTLDVLFFKRYKKNPTMFTFNPSVVYDTNERQMIGSVMDILRNEIISVLFKAKLTRMDMKSGATRKQKELELKLLIKSEYRRLGDMLIESLSKVSLHHNLLPEIIIEYLAKECFQEQTIWILNDGQKERNIGKYTICGRVGQGGQGTVYEAIDRDTAKKFAIKTLHLVYFENDVNNFLTEVKCVQELGEHNNLVPYIDYGYDQANVGFQCYIVMPLYKENLRDRIDKLREQGNLFVPNAFNIALEIAYGIRHMHSKCFVYRDLKADNILLDIEKNGKEIAKIGDFGLMRNWNYDKSVSARGSPITIAPEMAFIVKKTASFDTSVDIFSFGCVLFELLTLDIEIKLDVSIEEEEGSKKYLFHQAVSSNETLTHFAIAQTLQKLGYPNLIQRLIISMIQLTPSKRPKLDFVCELLQVFQTHATEIPLKTTNFDNPITTNDVEMFGNFVFGKDIDWNKVNQQLMPVPNNNKCVYVVIDNDTKDNFILNYPSSSTLDQFKEIVKFKTGHEVHKVFVLKHGTFKFPISNENEFAHVRNEDLLHILLFSDEKNK